MSTQSTALRKRGTQAPGSGTTGWGSGRKLGARRLQDITNKTSGDAGNGKGKKPGRRTSSGKGGNRDRGSGDGWGDAWDAWTDSATKTLEGVTKLVTEDGKPDLHGRGNGTIVHNGTVISSSRSSANKATSVSRDISALRSQGFKAFSQITKAANSFAQAIEETIDDVAKDFSRSFVPPGDSSRSRPAAASAAPSFSSPAGVGRAGPSEATRLGGISPPKGTFVALHAQTRRTPPKPKETMDKLSASTSGVDAGAGGKMASTSAVDYLGQLWTKDLGDILTSGLSGVGSGSSSSLARQPSPENKEILHRLHTKALEKEKEAEETRLKAKKLHARNTKLETKISEFKTACDALKRENDVLKTRAEESLHAEDAAQQQLGTQLQILLEEKMKLQRENQRLLTENSGLQELLSYAIPGDGDEVQEACEGSYPQGEW